MQIWSLLSSSYSGSTLLSMLLGSYPRTLGFGDTYNYHYVKDINDTQCACGTSPSYQCPVRVDIVERMERSGYDGFEWVHANPTPLFSFLSHNRFSVKVSRSHYLARVYRHMPDFIRLLIFRGFYIENRAFFSAIGDIGDYDYYFDGAKSVARVELLRTIFPGIKVIHLVRHPAGYLNGCLKRGIVGHKKIIDGWIRYNTSVRRCMGILGNDRYLLVRFEGLVADPTGTISQIYRFLGLPDNVNEETLHINKASLHVVGNIMKESFKRIEPRFIKIPDVETQWREYIRKTIRANTWLQEMYSDY